MHDNVYKNANNSVNHEVKDKTPIFNNDHSDTINFGDHYNHNPFKTTIMTTEKCAERSMRVRVIGVIILLEENNQNTDNINTLKRHSKEGWYQQMQQLS